MPQEGDVAKLVRRKYTLTLTEQVADQVDRIVEDERLEDAENFRPARAQTSILESLIRLGLELRRARMNLRQHPPTSDKPQKAARTGKN